MRLTVSPAPFICDPPLNTALSPVSCRYLPLRQTSATVGTLFIVVVFLSCRAIGLGRASFYWHPTRSPHFNGDRGSHPSTPRPPTGIAATFAAWLAMLELVVLVQSRAILCDIFLYTFNIATIGASFASQHPSLKERGRLVWCFVTGILLGCALSVKLTAIGTLAVVGIHQAMSLFREAFMTENRDISQVMVSAPRVPARCGSGGRVICLHHPCTPLPPSAMRRSTSSSA